MVTKCSIRQSLDSNEIREIKEIMEKNSFSTLSSLYKKLSEIFRSEGVTELDTRAAYESGLYDLQGMSEINLDEIDDLLYKIEGTLLSKDIYVTPSSDDVASFMDTSKKTILGTPEFISQEEIEEEIISKVENPKNTSEVSSLVNNLPYSSFAERFNSNEAFRDKVLKNVGMYTKVQTLFIEDGVPTTKNLTYYKNLQRTVKQDNDVKSLLADVEYLEEIDDNVWAESQEEINEVLQEIEERQFNENAIDIFGLNKYSSNKELVISTLDSLGRMIENPTNENIFNFSEKFTSLVPQQESSFSEIIPENLEPYSQNIFKVHSGLSESSLFRDHGLVKIGDNLYHKVNLGNRSDLYEQLYQKAKETGSPINLKSQNKEEALRELSQYVMLQDSTVDKDIREDHTLNKLIFNHPKIQDINDYSQLSDITTNPEYLVGAFSSDFNDYIVIEKQNDSQVYRSVLSKFRVGESGIYLTAPIKSIEGIDFQRELEDYIRFSKDQSMKYLLPARTTELKKDSDLVAINNPMSVTTYSRQYTVDSGLLVTESVPDNNIRFFGKTYSKVAEDTKNSIFKQIPENLNNNFYSINKDFITEEDRQIASRILNDAKFSFVDPVVTKQDFDKSVEKAGIQNEIKFSIGTAYSNEYVALSPDVQIKRGENYQFDLEWDVLYKGSAVGKMYYSREDKTWVDALNYSRKDFEWMVSENKNEAANILAERYKPKEKVDILAVTLGEMTKTASISRNPVGKELIYNNNLLFDLREFDGNLELSSIYSIEPNKGTATAFMRHLSEVADKNNYTITLTAKPFSDRENKMTFNQLVGFYRKHGFKPSRDFVFDTEEDGLVMVREPRYEQEVDSFDGLQNYERWRGQNKEYSRADIQNIKTGEPVVIRGYHGTTNEFYEFDASVKGNVEGHLGKMNYFTSDYQDASSNYLSDGADIKLRVGQLTDKLELAILDENLNEDEEVDLESVKDTYKISDEDIEEVYPDGIPETINARDIANFIANRDLVGSEELVLDLYVKLNNPVVLGKDSAWIEVIPKSEYIDYLDDAAQEIADEYGIDIEEAKEDYDYEVKDRAIYNSGAENIILTALSDALEQNGYDYNIASEILSNSETELDSQVDLNIIEKAIRDFGLYENFDQELASAQVVADMFKNLGYDGIILTNVKDRFKGMNLNEKTSHIHVFDEYSNQIKLADGSNTHFGSTSDIRYSISGLNRAGNESVLPVIDKLKESKLADNVKLMTSKEIDAQLGRLGVNLKTRKQVSAYHGSPYSFDKFTTSKMGTGEGNQAFGWGLYFTDLESIAKDYAEQLSKLKSSIPSINLNGVSNSKLAFDIGTALGFDYLSDGEYSVSKVASDLSNSIKETEDYLKNIKDDEILEQTSKYVKSWKSALNALINSSQDTFNVTSEKGLSRNVYKVTLHGGKTPDQYTWLEWDKRPSLGIIEEFIDYVYDNYAKTEYSKKALDDKKIQLLSGKLDIKTNQVFYENFAKNVLSIVGKRSNKDISMSLLGIGIDGIKYPAESRYYQATSDSARGFNYVVFDENAITIDEAIQFKKTLSEKGIKPIVNGFVYNNDVYLNRDTITNETPIHEFNHLFTNWMKSNRPSLYNQGINLVKQEVLKSEPGNTTMYRGVGRNFAEGINSAFTWVASNSETAANYGEVQEVKVSIPARPFEFPYKSNVDVRGEDIANLLRSDVYSKLRDKTLDKEAASKIMREIDSYQESAGESLEKYHTKVSKPEASDKIKGILERLGYDGIFINEGKGTYAIFKSEIQNVIDYVKQTQPNLQGESLYEEILTELTGREGAALVESGKKSGIIEWLKNFFKEIGDMLGILDATPAQVANMTVREFAKSSAVQLLKGEDIMSKMNLLRDSISNATTFSSEYTPINDTVDSVTEELRACN